jgi:Ca2+-binding RTX toxin-like protein
VFTYTASTGQGGEADSTLTVVVTAKGSTYLGGTPGVPVTGPNGHSPVLDGGAGNDTLVATKGATVLIGGPGDTLTGGKGADTYVFTGHFGQNTITNYNPDKDIIALDHTEFANAQTAATQVGANTVISDNAGDTITLTGVNLSQLHFDANHFVLV